MAKTNPRYSSYLDPAQKYALIETFYEQSLFPFLTTLDEIMRLTWNGIAQAITYEVQVNQRAFSDTLTVLSDVREPLIRIGQICANDVLEMQIAIRVRLRPELNHSAGTGALVAFRYHNGHYELSDDWTYSLIKHQIDQPVLLNEAQDLLRKLQAHLLMALAHEHPSVTEQYKIPPIP